MINRPPVEAQQNAIVAGILWSDPVLQGTLFICPQKYLKNARFCY